MKNIFEQWIDEYQAAKQAEEVARERRYAAEAQIAKFLDGKEEGQTTERTERYKVTAKRKINRTVDAKVWTEIAPQLPPEIAENLVQWKPSLVLKGYRWIEENDPATFSLVSRAVTSRPAKVAVTVEEIE